MNRQEEEDAECGKLQNLIRDKLLKAYDRLGIAGDIDGGGSDVGPFELSEAELDQGIEAIEGCIDEQKKALENFAKLLNCRAGKLLLKGKFFLCVAHDEAYFTAVYEVIRAREKVHGKWTDEDEECYINYCGGGVGLGTHNIPELQKYIIEYGELSKARDELAKLKHGDLAQKFARGIKAIAKQYIKDVT